MSNVRKPTPQDMWQLAETMDYDLKNQILETSEQIILVIQKPMPIMPIIDGEDIFDYIDREEFEQMDADYKAKQEQKQKEQQDKELYQRLRIDFCKED